MAVKNSCTPQNIYGPYQHTLFLGWSVMDFTASAGWNEQYSTLTVKLVQDPCSGTRKYLNQSFNWVSANFPNGDPAFNGVIGQSALFKVEDFEFAGIIQSITETKGSDGNPTKNVSLISPGVVLEGTQIIIDGYAGSVNSLPNIVNLFAFLESQNANCPQIGGFGSPAGGFGFARRTDRGIPWLLAKPGLQVLLGGDGHPSYSPYGGIKWKGGSSGYGLIGSDLYILDLSELPGVNSINYRIPGPSATVLELISTVCRDAGFDFYVDLLPAKGGPGGILTNIIKIRTISRRNQPALGAIQSFVNNRDDIISNSVGQELRADKNSAFVVGGQKRQIYSTYGITPFWGYNDDGGLNTATFIGNQWVVSLDTRALNLSLNTPIGYSIVIDEGEILAAQGDMDTFRDFVILSRPNGDLAAYLTAIGIVYPIIDLSRGGSVSDTHPLDSTVTAGLAYGDPTEASQQDLQTLFNFISSYANDVYGRKWLVQIPWVCVTTDTDTGEYLWSDLPSTEGGWYESTPLLGMPYPSPYTNFFADEQGKIGSIVQFAASSGISLEDINNDEYVTDGTYVWIKADLQDRWVIDNNYAYALITTSSPVLYKREVITDAYRKVIINSDFRNPTVPGGAGFNVSKSIDKSDVVGEFGVPFVPPFAVAVPILSNTQTYGPWIAAANAKGTVYFEKDDGLVPWEYGSTSYMNLAALAKINESITEMQTSERGSITMPGYPTVGLGSAIDQTITSVVTRVTNTSSAQGGNYYYTSDYTTDNSAAQISNINVTVGPQGVTTQVDVSTFTPVFGRFSRGNAERLKQIGQLRYQTYRNIDSKITQAMRVAGAISRGGGRPRARYNTADAHKSSAIVLLGKKYGNRPAVNIPTATMITAYDDYDQSSLMTLDGVFRPIQKRNGAATGLPKEVESPTPPASQPNYTWAPSPPLNEYTQLVVNTDYLNFLNNPTSGSANRSDTPNDGHDIQGVARSSKSGLAPTSGIFTIPTAIENGGVGYTDDYRYLGLRGPLVVHGWGYDVMGKPVPNASGDSVGSIDSSYSNKSDKFKSGWLQNDLTWPAAPVDLRYDRKRGVWTIPPGFRMLKVRATGVIDAGSSETVIVLNVSDVYDSGGLAIPTGTVLLSNFTRSKICPGELLAEYDEQTDQYWPLFPGGNTCADNCSGQSCTYTAVSSGSTIIWQSDSGNCCEGFKCSQPSSTPTGVGDTFEGECVQCSGATCSYTSIYTGGSYRWSADSGNCTDCGDYTCSSPTGTPTATGVKQYGQCKPCEGLGCQFSGISNGMGGYKWSAGSGCQDCSNFRCAEPTGNPTGLGQIYNSQCEPCEGARCSYSGSAGTWVPLSGNCNSSCISGTVQCSEPTGTVVNGTIQYGECTPCDEYPCRWVAVGSSWQQTGVGCTGCFNSSGSYECVYPPTSPTTPGQIYTSVCQPPQPTGTSSCTINEIELVCGLSSGIQIRTTPITFTVSGDGMICIAGQTVISTCDTCCGGGGGGDPSGTGTPPGDNCGSSCGFVAECLLGGCNCPVHELIWNPMGYSCKPGCECAGEPTYRPSGCGEIGLVGCFPSDSDPGGPVDDDVPVFNDPAFNPIPNDDAPIVCTTPQGGAWPPRDILYNPSIPNGFPSRLEVILKGDLTYGTAGVRAVPLRTEDYKPARVIITGNFFNTPFFTGVGFTGYPHYLSAASSYEVLNELASVTYTATGDCTNLACSGDGCEYISTGTGINDWVESVSCSGCGCRCIKPTIGPTFSGQVYLTFCGVYTGIDGSPLSGGYLYQKTENYKYNIPAGTQATIIHYANGKYRVAEYKSPKTIVSGSFTGISFYDKVFADASTGNMIITLPVATGNGIDGNTYTVKKVDSSANLVIVTGAGSELIDGYTTYTLYNQYESAAFTANNGKYYVI